jgi:hypothetical protein
MRAPVTPATTGKLRLDDVYLAGSTGQGPAVVGGLALVADERGLCVVGPQPTSIRIMPWGRVTTMSASHAANLPDGRDAVTLDVEIGGQALRFLVPEASLGPQGIGLLESRLSSLARIPVTAGQNFTGQTITAPVALGGGGAAGPPGVSGPPGVVMPGSVPAVGAQNQAASGGQVSVWAPATGGTLLGGQATAGPATVQVGKKRLGVLRSRRFRRGRTKRLVAIFVVVVIVAGAGAFYEKEHKGSLTQKDSADMLIAAAVNLDPGQVPGWKGITGTTAGVLGAYGFRDMPGGQPVSAGHQSVLQRAASAFAKCTRLPASSDGVLTSLGFSDGLGSASGQTASSASPLFEDPAQTSTLTESSALVLATKEDLAANFSVFARPQFAPCFSRFLDAVVPDLVGGPMTGIPFSTASVRTTHRLQVESGIETVSFSQTYLRSGRESKVALSGSIDVIGGGRTIAVLETLTAHTFPTSTALKLFASVEQNVAGESS